MQKDPRFNNKGFAHDTLSAYFSDYRDKLHHCLGLVSPEAMEDAAESMAAVRQRGGRVFVGGNGGSAAISEHLSCDWQKGVHLAGHSCIKVHCLTSNTALLTAIANDLSYADSFSYQLELADLDKNDLLVLISSSGNSENIIKALQFAKARGCKIIGLSGFTGGKLKDMSDVSLFVPFENYGLVEDSHQVLMHVLAQFHDLKNREGK